MAFRVGQKVVCVDADGAPMLVKNGIYTIKSISPPTTCRWRGEIMDLSSIHLCEVDPEQMYCGFAPPRFRPAVDTKTDISIFTKMLRTKAKAEV
jgi:hypothetical protein